MRGRPLLAWLDSPSRRTGVFFAGTKEEWDFWSYDRIADLTTRVAWGLVDAGVRTNDVVCIAQGAGPEFVAAFFGAILAGATPSPVAPPLRFQKRSVYDDHLTNVLIAANPRVVLTHAGLADRISSLTTSTTLTVDDVTHRGLRAVGTPDQGMAAFALLQFTSGSTGPSRGVRVPIDALESNVAAIRKWLKWTKDDVFSSWLPVYHDMGLIGALICSVVGGSDLWLLQPEQFIRHPERYVRCFGKGAASLTVMPNFGLDYIIRRVQRRDLAGFDCLNWRGIVVGSERIDAKTLRAYSKLLSPFGFDHRALLPAYGMAEASLAVTGVRVGDGWNCVRVHPPSLSLGCKVVFTPSDDPSSHAVVGCGRPLDGVEIAIVDEDDNLLPDGSIGEILVDSSSLADGYTGTREISSSLTRFKDGTLHTGDAGFTLDGELFVLGRLGDSMKVRGRVIFGEDLELAVCNLGVPRDRVVALLGVHQGTSTVILLFEKFNKDWGAVEGLVHSFATGADVLLIDAPIGTIARTSSGKPRRRELWRTFINGQLPGKIVQL